jgi:hypothetical protein
MYVQWLKHSDRNSQYALNEIDCCACGALFENCTQRSKNDDTFENETLLFISTTMSGRKLSKYIRTFPEKQFYAHRARGITDRR